MKSTTIYKRLLSYVLPYKFRIVIAIVFAQLNAIATALIPAVAYVVINGIQNKESVKINNIEHVPFLMNIEFSISWVPIIVVGVFALRSISEYVSHYQMASVGIRAIRKVRDDLYEHLVHLSHDFYAQGRTGDFLSRIVNDVKQIQGAITDVIKDLIKQPFVILYNIAAVFIFGGVHALLAMAIFPVVLIPIVMLGRSLRRTTKKMQQREADITSFIGETLSGFHIVKAFNREDAESNRFKAINKAVFDFFKKTIKVTIVQRPLIEIMGAVGTAVAIWSSLDTLSLDRFAAFVGALFIFYEPLKKLSKVNNTIQQSIASGSRIFEILDAEPTVKNAENAFVFDEAVHDVRYQNVSFSYDGTKDVLKDVSFSVGKGEVIAFVGLSGSGKTTLVSLLPRFYDPKEGSIQINGRDIRDLTLFSLRDQIGIVSQETVLFSGTIRDNIVYGRPDASDEDVRRAAKAAHAEKFIEEAPDGYNTQVGERGLKLSGGQRQRLSIARAILSDPPILILDEATSHLDTESEREVQAAIENLMQGRTVFVIAHRLSTIQKANKILVMQDGEVIEQGSNEDLLKDSGGVYKRLYDLQFD